MCELMYLLTGLESIYTGVRPCWMVWCPSMSESVTVLASLALIYVGVCDHVGWFSIHPCVSQ